MNAVNLGFLGLSVAGGLIIGVTGRRLFTWFWRWYQLNLLIQQARKGTGRNKRRPALSAAGEWWRRRMELFSRATGLKGELVLLIVVGGGLVLAMASYLAIALYLKKHTVAVVVAVLAFLIPEQALETVLMHWYSTMERQMGLAVQVFATEYRNVSNIQLALNNAIPHLPLPIREAFENAAQRLNTGWWYRDVFRLMAEEINNRYAWVFANLLIASQEDASAGNMLGDIVGRVARRTILQKRNVSALAGIRITAAIVNLAIFPVYLLTTKIAPGTYEFVTQTPEGEKVLWLGVASLVMGYILNRVMSSV